MWNPWQKLGWWLGDVLAGLDRRRRDMVCKIIGHAKPEQKLYCKICSRCRVVLKDSQIK